MNSSPLSLVAMLAEFPLFVLRLFTNPRSLVRGVDWNHSGALEKHALFCTAWLAILVAGFADWRMLATVDKPLLSTFKGIVMRAHLRSWDWLGQVYAPFNLDRGEAMRLWDILLLPGFLIYALAAGLLAVALVARLRMWRYRLSWEHAIGTSLLAYSAAAGCAALALVPLSLLLICRHCYVRLGLSILLLLAAFMFMGYYTLGDLGERPRGIRLLLRSLGYGLVQYLLAYIIFLALIMCVIPM